MNNDLRVRRGNNALKGYTIVSESCQETKKKIWQKKKPQLLNVGRKLWGEKACVRLRKLQRMDLENG